MDNCLICVFSVTAVAIEIMLIWVLSAADPIGRFLRRQTWPAAGRSLGSRNEANQGAFPSRVSNAPAITNLELLANQPDYYCSLDMPLDTLIADSENSPKQIAALNQNVPFAPPAFPHMGFPMETL